MEDKSEIQKDLASKEKIMKDDISNLTKKQKVSSLEFASRSLSFRFSFV